MIVHKAGFIVVIVLFISVTLITSCYQDDENNWENAIRDLEFSERNSNNIYTDVISLFINSQKYHDTTYNRRILTHKKYIAIDSVFHTFSPKVDEIEYLEWLQSIELENKEDSLVIVFLAMAKDDQMNSDIYFDWLESIVEDWYMPEHGVEFQYAYLRWLTRQQKRFYDKGMIDYMGKGVEAALYLIADSELFQKTKKDFYLSLLYNIAIENRDEDRKELEVQILNYFNNSFALIDKDQLSYYLTCKLVIDDSEKTLEQIEQSIDKNPELSHLYISLALKEKDPQKSIFYLNRFLSQTPIDRCDDQVFIARTSLIEKYLELNDLDQAQKHRFDIDSYLSCALCSGLDSFYYNQTISKVLTEEYELNPNNKLLNQIDSLLKQNGIWAEAYFVKYQSLHMADFYSGNTESQFLNKIKYPQVDYNSITQLIYNTRHINLKKALSEKKNPDYQLDSLYSALHTLERKLAPDFNKGNFNNPLFLEQWHLAGQLVNRIGDETEQQEVKALDDWRVDLKSIQKKLGNETNLVTYLKGEQYYWELTIAKDQIHLDTISVDIDEQLDAYNPRNNNTDITLLQQEFLTHVDGQEVIIMPDGLLTEFPFDIILGKGQWYSTHTDLRSFTEDEALTLSGEITLLSYTDDNTIGIGKKTIRELPFGFEECQVIADMLPQSKLITGHALDRHKLVESMESEILHLSTHGNTESYNRMANYLVVRDNNGKPTKVYVDEISQLDKAPILVNLSACSTAGGKHHLGEGTYSIARSFIQAGSETVIKTLWPVQEDITKEFMIQLYRHWLTGITIGEAMMRTKASFQSQADRPTTDWAGYVLEGNTQLKLQQQ